MEHTKNTITQIAITHLHIFSCLYQPNLCICVIAISEMVHEDPSWTIFVIAPQIHIFVKRPVPFHRCIAPPYRSGGVAAITIKAAVVTVIIATTHHCCLLLRLSLMLSPIAVTIAATVDAVAINVTQRCGRHCCCCPLLQSFLNLNYILNIIIILCFIGMHVAI